MINNSSDFPGLQKKNYLKTNKATGKNGLKTTCKWINKPIKPSKSEKQQQKDK